MIYFAALSSSATRLTPPPPSFCALGAPPRVSLSFAGVPQAVRDLNRLEREIQESNQEWGGRLSARNLDDDVDEAAGGAAGGDADARETALRERISALGKQIGDMRKARKQRPVAGKTDDCLVLALRPAMLPAPRS